MPKREYKYKGWSELFEAFRSGELDAEKYMVIMDNDNCCLAYTGNDEDEACDHCDSLFHGGGYGDIVEVLKAAGIPAEWC